jgi:hypothetical protein
MLPYNGAKCRTAPDAERRQMPKAPNAVRRKVPYCAKCQRAPAETSPSLYRAESVVTDVPHSALFGIPRCSAFRAVRLFAPFGCSRRSAVRAVWLSAPTPASLFAADTGKKAGCAEEERIRWVHERGQVGGREREQEVRRQKNKTDQQPKQATLMSVKDEVKSITRGAVPPGTFDPPAAYREVKRPMPAPPA